MDFEVKKRMGKTLAIFDLDSTLLDGDCEIMWCYFLAQKGLGDDEFLEKVKFFADEYETGRLIYADFERHILGPLRKLPQTEGSTLIAEYLQALTPYFRPYMLPRVEQHQRQGDTLLLATASNHLLAEPVAKRLGIPNLICTRIKMEDGIPGGELAAPAPYREKKAEQVNAWIAEHSISLAGSWGYSDSHNDLPILSLVENAVAVTPDETLRQHALAHGWQIIEKPTV
jgi:HAD-superfamily subfamily IB hydrolase, TIGR01490